MEYPVNHHGSTLMLEPALAGTLYHLLAHPGQAQRIPRAHLQQLRRKGVRLATVFGVGVIALAPGQRPSTLPKGPITLRGDQANVRGKAVHLSPAEAVLLRAALEGRALPANPSNCTHAYRLRGKGIPTRYCQSRKRYYLENET